MRRRDRIDTGLAVRVSTALRRRTAAVMLVLAAVSAACARSDEDRIRRQLDEVAQTVSIEDQETAIIRQARATRLSTYLTVDANIDVGAPFSPVVGRNAVARVVAAVRVPAGGVSVEFSDVRVTVDDQTRRAIASATARVAEGSAVGGALLQTRVVDVVFSEIAGEWLIDRVRLVSIQ